MPDKEDARPEQPALGRDGEPLIYRSDEILRGRREVWIEHGDEMYRLRLTAAGRLYLSK